MDGNASVPKSIPIVPPHLRRAREAVVRTAEIAGVDGTRGEAEEEEGEEEG